LRACAEQEGLLANAVKERVGNGCAEKTFLPRPILLDLLCARDAIGGIDGGEGSEKAFGPFYRVTDVKGIGDG
jgi:hypothetical protein